jgi:hypothetical protein
MLTVEEAELIASRAARKAVEYAVEALGLKEQAAPAELNALAVVLSSAAGHLLAGTETFAPWVQVKELWKQALFIADAARPTPPLIDGKPESREQSPPVDGPVGRPDPRTVV